MKYINYIKTLIIFIISTSASTLTLTSTSFPQWIPYNTGIYGGDVKALAANGSTIFAGLNVAGTYRSTDNGTTWTKMDIPAGNSAYAYSICISGQTVIASCSDGMSYRSTDNGDTWKYIHNNLSRIYSEGSRMYAWGYQGTTFYYSDDNGATWKFTPTGLSRLATQAFAVHNGIIYCASLNVDTYVPALLRSTDNGKTWTEIGNGLASKDVRAIAFNSSYMYAGLYKAGAGQCLYRSSDNGDTWENANLNVSNTCNWVNDITVSGSKVFVAAYDGMYVSTDNGSTWSYESSGLANPHLQVLTANNTTIFAGTNGAGVYRSTDSGSSWTSASSGLTGVSVFSFGADDKNLYAGTQGNGVYRSANNGLSWTEAGLKHADIMDITSDGSYLVAATLNNKINISTDNGTSWVNNANLLCYNFAAMIYNDNFYAATDFGVLISTDYGVKWTVINNGLTNTEMRALAAIGDYVFAGSLGSGVFRTNDDGQNWAQVNNGLTSLSVNALMTDGSKLYAATQDGVFVSADNGTAWTSAGLSGFSVSALTLSGSSIYAGTANGVYLTTDDGKNWTPKNDGLKNLNIMALFESNGKLFAGSWGTGVWMMPIIADGEVAVWPGDANNDGIVNTADVLPVGLYYNKTGNARAAKASFWEPIPVKQWTPDMKPAFADCDGNGLINSSDVLSIGLNYGKTHEVTTPEGSSAFAGLKKTLSDGKTLSFRLYDMNKQPVSLSSLKAGEEYFLSVVINDAAGLMGLSFNINWTRTDGKISGIKIIDGWETSGMRIGDVWGSGALKISKISPEEAKMAVGICRTDAFELDGKDAELTRVKIKVTDKNQIRFDLKDLHAIDKAGNAVDIKSTVLQSDMTVTEDSKTVIPSVFKISNYPNPFNPETKIQVTVPDEATVSLSIFNSIGQEVARLIANEKLGIGTYEYNWNASDLPSGIYICRLHSSNFILVNKMILLK